MAGSLLDHAWLKPDGRSRKVGGEQVGTFSRLQASNLRRRQATMALSSDGFLQTLASAVTCGRGKMFGGL